jgi:hypothetical protein
VTEHDEADCPRCQDCPGCEGGLLIDAPANPVVIRLSGGYSTTTCGDCEGEGVICDCPCHTD